jgi:hypothetical protein
MAQGIYADIYTQLASRNRLAIEGFLADFAENWVETAESYELYVDSEPQALVLNDASAVLDYCQAHPEIEQSIYWRNAKDQDPLCAMVFFTSDGGAIIGLSIDRKSLLERMESRLRQHSGDGAVLRLYESPPPGTVREFKEALRQSSVRRDSKADVFQLDLGQPTHGWWPIQIHLCDYRLSVPASNVLNDPISELIDLADFATFPRSGLRRVCLWEEPSGYVLDGWHLGPSRMAIAIYLASDLVPPMTTLSATSVYQCVVPPKVIGLVLVTALSNALRDNEAALAAHWRVSPSGYLERLLHLQRSQADYASKLG